MLECVDWFNQRRLLGPIGEILPAEFEQMYYKKRRLRPRRPGANKRVFVRAESIQRHAERIGCVNESGL